MVKTTHFQCREPRSNMSWAWVIMIINLKVLFKEKGVSCLISFYSNVGWAFFQRIEYGKKISNIAVKTPPLTDGHHQCD